MIVEIAQAEHKIAKILADLEANTDSLVEDITIVEINVTHLLDDRPRYLRSVHIELKRRASSQWKL